MLGKLIKHEFKATYRVQTGLSVFVFLLSLIAMFLKIGAGENPENYAWAFGKMITSGMAIFGRIAIVIITIILAIWRYRKNILKDEGYLMNTLPVKKSELLLSKIIVPYVWIIVDFIVIYLSVSLEYRRFINLVKDLEMDFVGEVSAFVVVMFVLMLLVSIFYMLSNFYFCLNIGYSRTKDKDLFSFVAYIVVYLINQIINVICLFVSMAGNVSIDLIENEAFPLEKYFTIIFSTALISMIIFCVVCFVGSVYLLNKKISLE